MILPTFLTNPFVIGSLGLSAGSLLGYVRNIPRYISSWFERVFTCSLHVANMDDPETFDVVRKWLAQLDKVKNTRNVTGVLDGSWVLTPAPGSYFFVFEGRPTWLYRSRKDPQSDLKSQSLKYQESISIRMLTRNHNIILQLCETIKKFSNTLTIPEGSMKIYAIDYGSWYSKGIRTGRPLESVILPDNQMERVVDDLENFFVNKDWYRQLGIPYRRGWLLQGPPGTGKTSLVSALSSHFRKRVYIFQLSGKELNDAKLLSLFGAVSSGSFILLEDIDAAFEKRDGKDAFGITFSGLLNALDGIASPEGTVVFMTTNHPENLDPALIRPGRIDQSMTFGPPTKGQLANLYTRFFPNQSPEEFVNKFEGQSIAQAQVALLELKNKNNVKEFHNVHNNGDGSRRNRQLIPS